MGEEKSNNSRRDNMNFPLSKSLINSNGIRKLNGRKKNRFFNMSKQDWIEANEMTKKSRGISKLSIKDIFGEDK